MRPSKGSKGSKKPSSPGEMQSPHINIRVIFSSEQNEFQKQRYMTRIQHKEPAFGLKFEVKGPKKTDKSYHNTHLFKQIDFQLLYLWLIASQCVSPIPNYEDGD
jgi:hypothetical protein